MLAGRQVGAVAAAFAAFVSDGGLGLGGVVNHDNLVSLEGAVTFAAAIYLVMRGPNRWVVAAFVLSFVAGLLTKRAYVHSLAHDPGCGAGGGLDRLPAIAAVGAARPRCAHRGGGPDGGRRRSCCRRARPYPVCHRRVPLQQSRRAKAVARARLLLDGGAADRPKLHLVRLPGFFGVFGYYVQRMPESLYWIYLALLQVGILGVVIAMIRRRRDSRTWWLLAVFAVGSLSLAGGASLENLTRFAPEAVPQGRYCCHY